MLERLPCTVSVVVECNVFIVYGEWKKVHGLRMSLIYQFALFLSKMFLKILKNWKIFKVFEEIQKFAPAQLYKNCFYVDFFLNAYALV